MLRNPTAGPAARDGVADTFLSYLRRNGLNPQVFTDRGAMTRALAEPAALARCRGVVAAGGDGTVGWTLNTFPDLPLAILPLGSENLLAKHLGLPFDPAEAAAVVVAGHTRKLDVGLLSQEGRHSATSIRHRFTLMASVGYDAAVVDTVHRRRSGHVQKADYLHAAGTLLWQGGFPRLRVHLPDSGETLHGHHAFFFNLPAYALDLPVCPLAVGDDGLLDMVLLQGPGRWDALRYFAGALTDRLHSLTDVQVRRIARAEIVQVDADDRPTDRSDVPLQADGDPAGTLPTAVAVDPARLTVMAPASA